MAKLVIPLVAGIILGYFLRNKERLSFNKIISGIILVLMFSLGFNIGSNNELLAIMPQVGLSTIILLSATLLFSVLFVEAARKLMDL
jgi:hypothetical protein